MGSLNEFSKHVGCPCKQPSSPSVSLPSNRIVSHTALLHMPTTPPPLVKRLLLPFPTPATLPVVKDGERRRRGPILA
jgi:hypothetical protein